MKRKIRICLSQQLQELKQMTFSLEYNTHPFVFQEKREQQCLTNMNTL